MKKLLGILVLGLGLVFSVNANSKEYCVKIKDDGKWPFYLNYIPWTGKCPKGMKRVEWSISKFIQFKKKIDDKYVPKTIASQSTKNKTTQIAKTEPSQTQEVAEKKKEKKVTKEETTTSKPYTKIIKLKKIIEPKKKTTSAKISIKELLNVMKKSLKHKKKSVKPGKNNKEKSL